ncbi:flagellar hook-associated protein 2 [Curtobacterium citreum]|uniref:Flagellar hook-associated protein 2 n=1 Tax=Curtobacterium citreum TaxID=2036 RepID=A0ABT2HCS1_9MICO|nr:flagellar filament capping protein FliD [Curtobacterium citreum]MCS6521044.1 flagellar filament capping protein FliD [Curtobacterium citreum]TQJ27898.1 flagellar hook-associated protein 2 [Curtobacterium citreum]GGL71204.1 flagellar hook-associated protein 2 [Curtobacterium citreum]
MSSVSSASSLAIDGLVSGLKTTDLINSLMTIEQVPQTLLKNKLTDTNSFISSLQTINGLVQTLASKATDAAKLTSLDVFTAKSSSTAATVSTRDSAAAGSLSFTIGATATAQVGVTAAMSTWASDAEPITIVGAGGKQTSVTPASGSLDDAVSAINGAAAGVTATKVAAGTATDGTQLFRLQLTATKTGAASAFQVYRGTGDQVTAGTATNVLTQTGAAVVTAAKDASVTLWAGTDAAQTVTSATNTFTDLLPGVDATVSAPSSDPVTVTIGQDTSKAQGVASGLVDALNAITAYYGTNTAVTSTTSPTTGTTSTTAGVLTGDATTRDVVQRLTSTMSTPVNGKSPSSIGIVITKDGDFTFDAAAFQKALADDPDGTQAVLSGVATNVGAAATAASDKYTGSITTSITGQQSVATDLSAQIDSWTDRLTQRRATLQAQYAALETSLSNLQSQSSFIASHLATLSSSS